MCVCTTSSAVEQGSWIYLALREVKASFICHTFHWPALAHSWPAALFAARHPWTPAVHPVHGSTCGIGRQPALSIQAAWRSFKEPLPYTQPQPLGSTPKALF
jgi:hypothetical protein